MASDTVLSKANHRGSTFYTGILFVGELPGGLPIAETHIRGNWAKEQAERPHC